MSELKIVNHETLDASGNDHVFEFQSGDPENYNSYREGLVRFRVFPKIDRARYSAVLTHPSVDEKASTEGIVEILDLSDSVAIKTLAKTAMRELEIKLLEKDEGTK